MRYETWKADLDCALGTFSEESLLYVFSLCKINTHKS